MDVTEFLLTASGKAERHDEENLLVQMQVRWEQPRKPYKSSSSTSLRNCAIMTIPYNFGNI